jgi:tRNA modification GTPase
VHVIDDTIVAVSSPAGRSARGILRLSGPGVRGVLERVVVGGAEGIFRNARVAVGVKIKVEGIRDKGEVRSAVVAALVTFYAGPASFTGQDVAEILLPGNPALLERVLLGVIAQGEGTRLAEPGEFTYRAFQTGKIDLTQAEGIAGMIGATNDAQLEASRVLTSGALGQRARALVDRASTYLALVEAGIDFTDQDDVVPIPPARLYEGLTAVREELKGLVVNSRTWGQVDAPARVVLVGMPSAGKSTLFNRMLGRSRSVISATAGTTRDVIEEPMTLVLATGQPVQVMLVDIAGLDDPAGWIDRQAQEAASRAIEGADLVLLLRDPTKPREIQPGPQRLPEGLPWVGVMTKADLMRRPRRSGTGRSGEVESGAEHPHPSPPPEGEGVGAEMLAVSAQSGEGVERLKELLALRLADRAVSLTGEALVLQPRHEACLRGALASLERAVERLEESREARQLKSPELIAQALRRCLDRLGELGGVMTPDDVLGKVFSTFCIGK